MVKLKIYNEEYKANKAVKGKDFVKLYDENNNCIVSFEGIRDFAGYEIIGGNWTEPEPTEQEKLRADVDFLMVMEGTI